MKKNLAAYRYLDEKVIPLYITESAQNTIDDCVSRATSFDYLCKRVFDFVFSAVVLVFGSPFLLLIAALIKLTSEGPVLFVQERVGMNGQPFRLYKFRTMMNGSPDHAHRSFAEDFIKGNVNGSNGNGNGNGNGSAKGVFKLTEDPRVTSIGRFLRKTSLDELPQFINVLRGEMSVVGPRPPLTYELDHYHDWHKKRLAVKPGLTGLWQVSGRSSVPFDEMVMLDLYYIENWTLVLDTKIMLRTLPVMFFGYGAY